MKFYVRLEQLLHQHDKKLSDLQTDGLTMFQLRNFVSSAVPGMQRGVMEKICDTLIEMRIATRDELPGILFSPVPDKFWHILHAREHVSLCMGVRCDNTYLDQVVVAADSVLQANLIYKMTHTKAQQVESVDLAATQIIHPHLVDTWDRSLPDLDKDRICQNAERFYKRFAQKRDDRALVCFGSIKSNPVIECILADCFQASPFVSDDLAASCTDRVSPVFIAYRDHDAHPESICGGRFLAVGDDVAPPGIHYESGGEWKHAPWGDCEDAALVVYRFDRKKGRLEVVLGGYSGRGSRCLAEFLRKEDGQFWPPSINGDMCFGKQSKKSCDLDLGVFVVRFELEPDHDNGAARSQKIKHTEVISVDAEALKHRAGLAA